MAGEMVTFSVADFGGEMSSFGVRVGVVTAGTLPGLLTQIGAIRTATAALILGTIQREQLVAFNSPLSSARPTNPNAQRERKWLVTYVDSLAFFDAPTNAIPNEGFGKKFQIEIPTANLTTDLLLGNTDMADLENAAWIAWVNAFEAMGRSPHGGTVDVLDVRAVGRNI